MSAHGWLKSLRSNPATGRGQRNHRRRGSHRAAMHRPSLEALEDRTLLTFSAPVAYAAGTTPTAVVTADFNRDGRLDLAVSNFNSSDVSILLANGDGTFQAARSYGTYYSPYSLAVGDFNGDGKLDLVASGVDLVAAGLHGRGGGGAEFIVLLGNGDGSFHQDRVTYTDGSASRDVAVGDFNSDGKLDLAVAGFDQATSPHYGGYYDLIYYPGNPATSEVTVLLGHGDGTFAASSSFDLGGEPDYDVATGDFNGDGKPDVVWTDSDMNAVGELLGDGDGTFQATAQYFGADFNPGSVTVADLNGDGRPDLTVANFYAGVSVLLGNGDGTFQTRNYRDVASPTAAAVADFDGDGKPDLVTANYFDDSVGVFLGNGDGSFLSPQFYAAGSGPARLVAGDFNGDGRPDLAVADSSAGVSVLLNTGDGGPLPPSLRINDVTVTEGNTGTVAATFAVTLSAAGTETITVAYATDNDTAAGGDYNSTSGTLTFAPGETSKTVTVLVNGDRVPEPTETFALNLSAPTNATIADGQGVGTILDDEPRISINDVTVTEGNTGAVNATFTVSLSVAYDVAVTVHYQTANGSATAGSDYKDASGDVTIAAGQTTRTFTIAVIGDRSAEPSEEFVVNLGAATNGLIVDSQGVGTIVDDEPRISIGDVSKKEGNAGLTAFAFTVSLSAAYDVPVTVAYATANGTATAGGDYQAATGTTTISAGQTSGTITVRVIGDRLAEPNETFVVNLGNTNYGVVVRVQGVGTILDDEPRISIGDVAKYEGKAGKTTLFTFTVKLSAAYDQAVTMAYRTADGTARTGDGDYLAQAGTLTFDAGETSKTITVVVLGDGKRESDEAFYLDLSGNGGNSLFAKKRGVGTIWNDDPGLRLKRRRGW